MKRKTPNSRLSPNRRSPKRARSVVPRIPVPIVHHIMQLAKNMRKQNIVRVARNIKRNNPIANRNQIINMIYMGYNMNGPQYRRNEIERALPLNHNLFV